MNRSVYLTVLILLALLMQQCFVAEIGLPVGELQSVAREDETVMLSTYTYHEPIDVTGDTAFEILASAEMWPGNGSALNPYTIEALNFTGDTYLLKITDVSLNIQITDCWFESLTEQEGTGIYLENCSSAEIDHSNFTLLEWGIWVYMANGTRIAENEFMGCRLGTRMVTTSNSSLTNNQFVKCGLSMYGCSFGNITSNEIVEDGIYIDGASVQECIHTVQDNWINGRPFGYFVSISNTALDLRGYGQVFLANTSRVTIEGASLNKTRIGMFVKHSSGCFIRDVICTDSGTGITLSSVANTTLKLVHCLRNSAGIRIDDCYNCSVQESQVSSNEFGLYIDDSIGIIVNASEIQENSHGVMCWDSSGVMISGCHVEHNTGDGLHFLGTMMAVALNNSILYNGGVGIFHVSGSAFGFFTYNKLGWNGVYNAYDTGSYSQWDDGVSLGNYWSDYTVPPTYTIPGSAGSVDRYPRPIIDDIPPTIVAQIDIPSVNSSVPVSVSATVMDVSAILEATLQYRVDGGPWNNITMEMGSTDSFWGCLIPPAADGSVVEFRVWAVDSHGNWGLSATVTYTVEDTTTSTTSTTTTSITSTGTTTGSTYPQLDLITIALVASAALLVILVLVVVKYRVRR